jgi:CDP-glycerol glycerophosphotransferase
MNKITKRILEAKFFQKIFKNPFKVMDEILASIFRPIYQKTAKINNNKIVFATFNGAYTCNLKPIAEEILRRELPYELVWVTKGKTHLKKIPRKFKVIQQESTDFLIESATAKLWISNSITMGFFGAKKKPSQILMQTWHGSIGIKRFETTTNKKWIRIAKRDGKQTDYCISNSKFEDDLYKNTFWKDAEVLTYGHARNDILLQGETPEIIEIKQNIREKLGIDENTKIALYAPTFRDDKELKYYDIDYVALKEALEKRFGGEWVILTRFHSRLRGKFKLIAHELPDFVLNANVFEDMQELLLVTDVGITDYSSWICDYMLRRKPGFLFTTDLKEYYSERGFYYPLEDLPFPIAENNSDLMNNILNFDEQKFQEKCEKFLVDKGCAEYGNATFRIVDKIEELMKG